MRLILIAIVASLLPTAASAEWKCKWGRWSVHEGSSGVMHVDIRSNVPCRLTKDLKVGGSHAIGAVQIASKPANGTANVSGFVVTYQSRPKFLGHDSFVFLIKGTGDKGPYTSTVQVELNVTDRL